MINKNNNTEKVYVVTRDKRRIEEKNYSTMHAAESRLKALQKVLKEYDPSGLNRIGIVCTKKPNQIR